MAKLCVGIIFGGNSTEYEISIQSAKNIINMIDKNRFKIMLLSIDKRGTWYVSNIDNYLSNNNDSFHAHDTTFKHFGIKVAVVPGRKKKQLINIKNAKELAQIDVIFPITHGALGENGSLQGILQMANLPFVGSDVLGSAVCMDKDITKRLLRDVGFQVAPFVTLTRSNYSKRSFTDLSAHLGLPLFIKPASQGSSIGVSKVYTEEQFLNAIRLAFKFDRKIIIEKNIKGREIECAILGNYPPQASICGEIILNNTFYSYKKKYINRFIAEIMIPAVLDVKINNIIRRIAISAYQELGCRDMARVDMFLTQKNEVIINEINTLPGFTNMSMYPRLWEASGISYSELISQLIELALERSYLFI